MTEAKETYHIRLSPNERKALAEVARRLGETEPQAFRKVIVSLADVLREQQTSKQIEVKPAA